MAIEERLRVLATCAYFEPGFKGGGPIRSMAHIVDTAPAVVDLTLITDDRDLGDKKPYPSLSGRRVRRGSASVFYMRRFSFSQWREAFGGMRRRGVDLLYVNSLLNLRFSVLPILLARVGIISARYVLIAPRGELASGALGIKALKKKLFLSMWLPFIQRSNVVWHATSPDEAADIVAVTGTQRIEHCPDYGSVPQKPTIGRPSGDVPRFVFISRIARVKNLDLSLKALLALNAEVEFDIYGPLEDQQYWSECEALIAQMPSHVRVRYCGELNHSQVRRTFENYDAFLFPSRSESYGHVIAESLSASCPVICSTATPWTDVLQSGGGIAIKDLRRDQLVTAISEYATANPNRRMMLRQATAQAFIQWRQNLTTPNIITQMCHLLQDERC